MEKEQRNKIDHIKSAVYSILIGACVAFLSSLIDGLADLLRTHSQEIVAGMTSTAVYLAKTYRV
jgi:hypothetical protein